MAMDKAERKHTYEVEKVRLKARKDFEKSGPGCGWVLLLLLAAGAGLVVWMTTKGGGRWPWAQGGAGKTMKQIDAVAAAAAQPGASGAAAEAEVEALIKAEARPRRLADLVRRCDTASRNRSAHPASADVYWHARMAAIEQFGTLTGEEAATLAVELMCDTELLFNDPTRRAFMAAVTRIGADCLPHLEAIPDEHPRWPLAAELIYVIQRGERFRP